MSNDHNFTINGFDSEAIFTATNNSMTGSPWGVGGAGGITGGISGNVTITPSDDPFTWYVSPPPPANWITVNMPASPDTPQKAFLKEVRDNVREDTS